MQLTTDGLRVYLQAVEDAFGGAVDNATLIKIYGPAQGDETRYSPPVCLGCQREVVSGDPNLDEISTSYVERQNLSMRMGMRRFTRLTNACSKRVENHKHAVALFYVHDNFGRAHMTLRSAPARAAEITNRLWTSEDIVGLAD